MTSELPPPTLIETQAALEELVEVLEGEDVIAVDTEADSFFSYREKVCLIQVTVCEEDFLVDPLADIDLSVIGPILADPTKVKIFHDGEYDVLILGREYGFRFANLFDTRIAASALGAEAPGLASVLGDGFGIVLDKSMQRSNWGERPLSQRQIDYARLDTRYLHELMERQVAGLEETGRRMILDGECRRLEQLEPTPLEFNPEEWVRLKGARVLGPNARQVCRELFILRDRLARESDQPPFRIMNNQAIVAAAAADPRNTNDLAEIPGFSWRQVRKIGDGMLDAYDRADELGPIEDLPRLPPKDGTGGLDAFQLELFDRLKTWRRNRADDEGFDASLILNRHALVKLVRVQPETLDMLEDVDGLVEWQIDRYGKELVGCVGRFLDDKQAGRIDVGPRRRGGGRGGSSAPGRRSRR